MQIQQEKLDFSNLDDVQKKEMEKHANFSQGNIGEHYDKMCVNYEEVYLTAGWDDPRKCADHVILNVDKFEG